MMEKDEKMLYFPHQKLYMVTCLRPCVRNKSTICSYRLYCTVLLLEVNDLLSKVSVIASRAHWHDK